MGQVTTNTPLIPAGIASALTAVAAALLTIPLGKWVERADPPFVELPIQAEQPMHPRLIEVASLGHLPSWVDAVLIHSLGDPSYMPVAPGSHPPLYFEMKLATELDPAFEELYWYGASTLSVIRRDGRGAEELLDRANHQIEAGQISPQLAPYLSILRAYNALFELQDFPLAQKAFEQAALLPGAPAYLADLIPRLRTVDGRFEIARRIYTQLLKQDRPDEIQARLKKRWQEVQQAEQLHRLNAEFSKWLGGRPPSDPLFQRFMENRNPQLIWDSRRQQVETREPREVIPGLY